MYRIPKENLNMLIRATDVWYQLIKEDTDLPPFSWHCPVPLFFFPACNWKEDHGGKAGFSCGAHTTSQLIIHVLPVYNYLIWKMKCYVQYYIIIVIINKSCISMDWDLTVYVVLVYYEQNYSSIAEAIAMPTCNTCTRVCHMSSALRVNPCWYCII